MHRSRLTPILLTLTFLIVLIVLELRQPTQAAEPTTASTVYLPTLFCEGCTGPSIQPTPGPANLEWFRSEVIRLVNIEREKVGCPSPVVANDKLMAATQGWAEYMRDNDIFQHATVDWYKSYGYSGGLENIAGGAYIEYPEYSLEAFWMSPTHTANLLACSYTNDPSSPSYDPTTIYEIGVGIADGYLVVTIGYGTK